MGASTAEGNGLTGIAFRAIDGRRSTSATGRTVFAEAARAVDSGLATAVAAERDWRKGYLAHARRLVEADVVAVDPVAVPRAGLATVEQGFEFVRDGAAVPARDAAVPPGSGSLPRTAELDTARVDGTGTPVDHLAIPYQGGQLTGDALRRQCAAWVQGGTVEPSFAEALERVADNPDWLDLSDLTIVVLGAGAEMGPTASLAAWGATVVAVDLPRPALWERVLATLRAGAGRAYVPVREPVDDGDDAALARVAGADLCTELPELTGWLEQFDGPLVVGNYVYAVGADNARVAVAADALTAQLVEQRPSELTLAGLLTPTDVYAAPEAAVSEAAERHQRGGVGARLGRAATFGRGYLPNYDGLLTTATGARVGIADCLIAQQGPNYALAKRLQRWRLRLARASGVRVSANIAPATRTRSVVRNRVLAAAYAGAHRFDVEVFEPSTSNTIMAALLVHDLRAPDAAGVPTTSLAHPLALFSEAAAHGGLWRQPYAPRSVLPLAALLGWPKGR